MSQPAISGFRLTDDDLARLDELRGRLQEALPFRKVTKTDAIRYAIATASGTMAPLNAPETVVLAPSAVSKPFRLTDSGKRRSAPGKAATEQT